MSVQTGLGKVVFFGSAIAISVAILIFSTYKIKRSDVLKVQIKEIESKEKEENKMENREKK